MTLPNKCTAASLGQGEERLNSREREVARCTGQRKEGAGTLRPSRCRHSEDMPAASAVKGFLSEEREPYDWRQSASLAWVMPADHPGGVDPNTDKPTYEQGPLKLALINPGGTLKRPEEGTEEDLYSRPTGQRIVLPVMIRDGSPPGWPVPSPTNRVTLPSPRGIG